MKTRFNITVGGFTVDREVSITRNELGDIIEREVKPVQIPKTRIEGELEYSITELRNMWALTKEIMEESPEAFKHFAIKLFGAYSEVEKTIGAEVASDENN